MANQLVEQILKQYGLQATTVHAAQKGYRNESYAATLADGQTVNLIIYKREPDILAKIRNANYVGDFLAEHGMPARHTADRRIIKIAPALSVKGRTFNREGFCGFGGFAVYGLGGFVFPKPFKLRVTHKAIVGPFAKAHFADQLGLDPMYRRVGFRLDDKWRGFALQLCQPELECFALVVGNAATGMAHIPQTVFLVHADDQ